MVTRSPYYPVVLDWARRVAVNGGGLVPIWILNAVNDHYRDLICGGVEPKIKTCVLLCPTNLIMATTPLVNRVGNDPWTNGNFVSSDLTKTGLVGNGSSKYLATGFNPSTGFASDTDAGLTIYFSAVSSGLYMDMRAEVSTNSYGMIQWNGYLHSDIYCGPSPFNGRLLLYGTYNGYNSVNRVSSSSLAAYRLNSTTAHYTIGSKTATTGNGSRPNAEIQAYCYYNGATRSYYSNRTFSYVGIHDGLTSAQSQAFGESIQRLRKAFGGGWV